MEIKVRIIPPLYLLYGSHVLELGLCNNLIILVVTVVLTNAIILYLGPTNRKYDTEISIIPNI